MAGQAKLMEKKINAYKILEGKSDEKRAFEEI
jgi:hypothetical protein